MEKSKNKMMAMIMLGGQSKRMGGGIKSLIKFNNKLIFDRILQRLKPQINKIFINCNNEEIKLKKYDIPIVKDQKKGFLGPLAGIHAGMKWIKNNERNINWLISIPGDTPFIPTDLVDQLVNKTSKKSKIVLIKSKNKIHPSIGLWHIDLFNDLNISLDEGTRKILTWAEKHPLEYINYSYKSYDPFFNINSKNDLKDASLIEKKHINELKNIEKTRL
tara:strand:- start:245 stop:898 length:654 start_codon:yes stop_codon:yes gene_type:complete